MDGKTILVAAEWCRQIEGCDGCPAEAQAENCMMQSEGHIAEQILFVRDYILGELREWAANAKRLDDYWTRTDVVDYDNLIDKLDSIKEA